MKWFIDGDQACVTNDDFVDLQTSPAVFLDADSEDGRTIQADGLAYLAVGRLRGLRDELDRGLLRKMGIPVKEAT